MKKQDSNADENDIPSSTIQLASAPNPKRNTILCIILSILILANALLLTFLLLSYKNIIPKPQATTTTKAPSSTEEEPTEEEASRGVLLLLIVLLMSIFLTYLFLRLGIKFLPESIVTICGTNL